MLTLLLLILLGIIDFGRLLFVNQAVKSASREGARAAVVRAQWGGATTPTATTADASALSTTVVGKVRDAGSAAAALGGNSTLSVAYSGGSPTAPIPTPPDTTLVCTSSGNAVTITVAATFTWLTPVGALPGLSSPGLTGTKIESS